MDIFEIFILSLIFLLLLFFAVVIVKKILFWLYLWQLKEYHIGRFIDHFRTQKGKELLINKINFLKVIAVFIFIYFGALPDIDNPARNARFLLLEFSFIVLFIIYLAEAAKAIKDFFQKNFKKPVFTKKILFLFITSITIAISFPILLFINNLEILIWLIIFDLIIPLIVSAVVLLFQPLAVWGRNRIIWRAKAKRAKFNNLLVIGITGSYGKTSTKEFLATILEEKFPGKVLKTKAHQNSEVGISQCILNELNKEHEIFVCEMGAYNRGGIKLLCDIAKPKIGVITGINEQHMATFGSLRNIIKAKFELIEALPPGGTVILNWDNDLIKNQAQNLKIKTIKYSISEGEELWAENIDFDNEFLSFRAFSKDGDSADFKLNLLGVHNVLNILGAAAPAKELGMGLKEISIACRKIKQEQSGFLLKKGFGGLNIIDATYSANPNGVISHLDYLKTRAEKKIIVMPCLIELGRASYEVHKRLGQKIGEVCDLAIITTKERLKELKEGAVEARRMRKENIVFIDDPAKIFEKIKNFCQSECVVLLESRVPKQLYNQITNVATSQ